MLQINPNDLFQSGQGNVPIPQPWKDLIANRRKLGGGKVALPLEENTSWLLSDKWSALKTEGQTRSCKLSSNT